MNIPSSTSSYGLHPNDTPNSNQVESGNKSLDLETVNNKSPKSEIVQRVESIFIDNSTCIHFDLLPDKIQTRVFIEASLDFYSMALINKKISSLIDEEFKKNTIISTSINQALNTLKLMDKFQSQQYYYKLAQLLLPIYIKIWLSTK